MSFETDTEYTTHTVTSVQRHTSGWLSLTLDQGLGVGMDETTPFLIGEGDKLRIYGAAGLGQRYRGLVWERGPDDLVVGFYRSPEEDEAKAAEDHAQLKAEIEARRREPIAPTGHPKYEWTADMGQISGFGGGYEAVCRKMVVAGLEWLDAHPEAAPRFRGYAGVYGLVSDDNKDAVALSKAVMAACPDCTGAMHQATVSACLFVQAKGWDEYCRVMREQASKSSD